MRKADIIESRIIDRDGIKSCCAMESARKDRRFYQWMFDILHRGHIYPFPRPPRTDCLVVGLNSDASTKRLKGEHRPVNDQQSRAILLPLA